MRGHATCTACLCVCMYVRTYVYILDERCDAVLRKSVRLCEGAVHTYQHAALRTRNPQGARGEELPLVPFGIGALGRIGASWFHRTENAAIFVIIQGDMSVVVYGVERQLCGGRRKWPRSCGENRTADGVAKGRQRKGRTSGVISVAVDVTPVSILSCAACQQYSRRESSCSHSLRRSTFELGSGWVWFWGYGLFRPRS
jgi:hypothetical protein